MSNYGNTSVRETDYFTLLLTGHPSTTIGIPLSTTEQN